MSNKVNNHGVMIGLNVGFGQGTGDPIKLFGRVFSKETGQTHERQASAQVNCDSRFNKCTGELEGQWKQGDTSANLNVKYNLFRNKFEEITARVGRQNGSMNYNVALGEGTKGPTFKATVQRKDGPNSADAYIDSEKGPGIQGARNKDGSLFNEVESGGIGINNKGLSAIFKDNSKATNASNSATGTFVKPQGSLDMSNFKKLAKDQKPPVDRNSAQDPKPPVDQKPAEYPEPPRKSFIESIREGQMKREFLEKPQERVSEDFFGRYSR